MFELFQSLATTYPHVAVLGAIAASAAFATVTSRWL